MTNPVFTTIQVIQRIAGRPLVGKATIEMTMLHVNGLQDKDLGAELVPIA